VNVRPWHRSRPERGGFTLIEVIAALVIFSLGVLMVIRVTTGLSRQMSYAAKLSTLVAKAQERLDSLESLPFDSLSAGTSADTLTVDGTPYARNVTVSLVTAVLYKVDISLSPRSGGGGPTYATTTYTAAKW
jgi:prepilin-type N-terminal cleavage/methylation domain-containing protein